MTDAFLFYVVGRSGVGKDTVLQQLRSLSGCTVAHRYITREPNPDSENHVYLTENEFQRRQDLGAFLLDWDAHGYRYGIGMEVSHWLRCGMSVFVNGSRHGIEQARKRVGKPLVSVLIDANEDVCQQRITLRGRESEAQIIKRMQRDFVDKKNFDWVIDNSGPLDNTINNIQQVLHSTFANKRRAL